MGFFKRLFGKSGETRPPSFAADSADTREESMEQLEKKAMAELESLPVEDQELFKSFLNRLSGQQNTPARFREELYDSLNRYYSGPELQIVLDLTDAGGRVLAEHEAFNGTFNQWAAIGSVWDRRSVLFELWDETEFGKLQKWQIVERFVKDRYAARAAEFHKAAVTQEDLRDIRLVVALSKMYRALDSVPEALHYAKGAFALRPDLDIVKVEYASALHLSAEAEDKALAHRLITEVIAEKVAAAPPETEIPLLNWFLFSEGYLDSSVFAANFLLAGKCDGETWEKMAGDYYWCPFFRLEHAVFLSGQGETLQALAKLKALADEFPWFRAGVLTAMDAIRQLRVQNGDPGFMEEEMAALEQYRNAQS